MPSKRYPPDQIRYKFREAGVLLSRGQQVTQVIPALGISERTYYFVRITWHTFCLKWPLTSLCS
jgi:hypothetical protein